MDRRPRTTVYQPDFPSFATSQYYSPVALVSSDGDRGNKVGAQYGFRPSNIINYAIYEKLAQMSGVDAIYFVLPNSMHKEFVVRGAKVEKHILCDKRWPQVRQTAKRDRGL